MSFCKSSNATTDKTTDNRSLSSLCNVSMTGKIMDCGNTDTEWIKLKSTLQRYFADAICLAKILLCLFLKFAQLISCCLLFKLYCYYSTIHCLLLLNL